VNPTAPNRERQRAAYLITFVCYGSWLHGREGSVDQEHNTVGSPFLAESSARLKYEKRSMIQEPYRLDERRRAATLEGIKDACLRRGWMLLAAHVRPSHVHVVVEADRSPEQVMSALKAYASQTLKESGCDMQGRRRWARHGSTRYLWTVRDIRAAVRYVIDEQGEPMETFMPAAS
jgi:REP element-mobilizing transposase RayT